MRRNDQTAAGKQILLSPDQQLFPPAEWYNPNFGKRKVPWKLSLSV